MAAWSFQRTLVTGMLVIGFLAMLSSAASLFASKILVASMEEVAADEARNLAEAEKLRTIGARKVADARAYLLTSEPRYARETRSESGGLRGRIAQLQARPSSPKVQELLARVQKTEQEHQDWFERAFALRATGASRGLTTVFYEESVEPHGAAFERALDALVAETESNMLRSLDAARASVERARGVLKLVTFTTLVLAVVLSLVLSLSLNRSYRQQASARAIAEARHSRARAAQSQAETESHLKDEFLATVSHELRNPLAPILAWTQLLRGGTLDREKSLRALEAIERNARAQTRLIDDLLDVSRVVSGKFRLDLQPIDLEPVIKAAVESQRPASEAKQIRLELELERRTGVVLGDAERLQQVAWNLLSNAIKYTPRGGRVRVALGHAGSHMALSVQDSGQGIDPLFLPHVFEPFRQQASGSARRHGGLGLGLSIVRHIVELHGGQITAHSDGLGRGATFRVQLPVLTSGEPVAKGRRRQPVAEESPGDVKLQRLDGARVLLVDDEPSTNEAVQALLESCGAEVQVADSARRALEVLDAWRPDVLVSDIAMPDQDGFALIREVRRRSPERGGEIPALGLTAYARLEDRVRVLSAGFQMYLSKPSDPRELVAAIASLAAWPRAGETAPLQTATDET